MADDRKWNVIIFFSDKNFGGKSHQCVAGSEPGDPTVDDLETKTGWPIMSLIIVGDGLWTVWDESNDKKIGKQFNDGCFATLGEIPASQQFKKITKVKYQG